MKLNLKKHTVIAVGIVGSLLWGETCILENQNAIAQVQGRLIINQLSNRCIDVEGQPGTSHATPLLLSDCELYGFSGNGGITDQKWEYVGGGFIRNVLSGKCIDVEGDPGTSHATPLILADCELYGFSGTGKTTDQRWEFISGGFIRNILSGRCIDVQGTPGTSHATPLLLSNCEYNGTTDQRWSW